MLKLIFFDKNTPDSSTKEGTKFFAQTDLPDEMLRWMPNGMLLRWTCSAKPQGHGWFTNAEARVTRDALNAANVRCDTSLLGPKSSIFIINFGRCLFMSRRLPEIVASYIT